MSTMYVANTTQQIQDFQFRLPMKDKVYKQSIDIGRQIKVAGELDTREVEAIIAQHSIYGMIEVSELDRAKPFVGLIYSLDKPVKAELISRAMNHNMGVLDARGQTIRQEAAVAINNNLAEGDEGFKAVEVEVIEVKAKKGGQDRAVDELIRVDARGPQVGVGKAKREPRQARSRQTA
jgi:hypothetical protein